ncbi:MAG: PAS domain S-box protein, partial [Rhodospirillales bacterium]|nr:PAS domain S-box protein [Rhodospirillales bacterium]
MALLTVFFLALILFPASSRAAETISSHLKITGHDGAVWGLGAAVLVSGIAFFLALVLWLRAKKQLAGLRAGTVDFRELAEFAGDWVWEMDEDLRFIYLSPRFFELFSTTRENILGKTRKEFLDDRDMEASGEKWKKHFRDLDAHRPFRDFKYPLIDTDGRTRLLRVSGKPVFDEDGVFRGYHGTGTDLTEEGEATAQAAKAEALLADAIESITAGFALFDADDRLVICNSRFYSGHPKIINFAQPGSFFEEILRGVAGLGLYHADMGNLDAFIEKRMVYHRNRPSDHEQHLSDGRWMHVYEFATHDGGSVLLVTNITERKKAEQAREESEIKFRNLIEGSVQGVLIHADHKPLFANQAYAEIFGYDSPEELFAHGSALDHVAPHERDRLKGYSHARVEGREAPVNYEFEGIKK